MSTAYEERMAPEASPGAVPGKAGVRRVNNVPIYIGLSLMGVFVLVMALVAWDRAEKQRHPAERIEEPAASTTVFAKEVIGEHKEGIVEPAAAAPSIAALDPFAGASAPAPAKPASGAVGIARPGGDLEAPPAPPRSAQALERATGPRDDEIERARVVKQQQLDEAVKARTSLNVIAPRSGGGVAVGGGVASGAPLTRDEQLARLAAVRQQIEANTRDDPTAAYKARLAQLQSSGVALGGPAGSSGGGLVQAPSTNNVAQFSNPGTGDRWKLDMEPEAPRSPYEVRAGFVLPATLISGVNSELPGQIIAQVAQNVFDTATGKHLLIPQGARLVGAYSSSVAYGQSRVLVAWQRIVFPDGKALDIGSMPGADSAGYAGFEDKVNNHYFRLFSSAILMSAVTAGIALSQPQNIGGNTQNAQTAMSEALGQQLGQVTAQLNAKNMNIAPTIEIRPGYRFNVMVTKDLTFSKPYRAFDY